MTIESLIEELIGREGDYSDHPADRGGPTRWGITQQVARAFNYQGDMRVLPRATAALIYRSRYFLLPNFDQVHAIYPRVGEELFDTGVNMGTAAAGGFLQRGLNLLNRGASDYPDISTDGRVGPMTIAALKTYRAKRGASGETVLLRVLDGFQLARYAEISESRPANEAFFYGWVANRVGALA